jgi:hypothetical protein
MALKRWALAGALAFVFLGIRGSAIAAKPTVRITFTGACGFVEDKNRDGDPLVTVYLPKWEEKYGTGKDGVTIDEHKPFVRFGGAALILPDRSIVGIKGKTQGPVKTKAFDGAVHDMKTSPWQKSLESAVSFALPEGVLTARGGYARWAFTKRSDRPPAGEVGEPMASTAVFELETTDDSPITLTVTSVENGKQRTAEYLVPFQNGVANLMIGNLMPETIFYEGTYNSLCEDPHFLLNYKLLDPSKEDPATVLVPKRVDCFAPPVTPKSVGQAATPTNSRDAMQTTMKQSPRAQSAYKDTYGPRDDCFMSRWPK